MMVGLLTESEKDSLIGQEFAADSYFNPIQDNNDNWIISQEEMSGCTNQEFIWVKNLTLVEFEAKVLENPF
jgi:K+-transporting ATPase c subunit